ncbi:MAG: hypothetical protein GWO08_20630 [Gammaproteobacteria bacterium]|nr:hypothetical protein [Gammaproteobacteria bacterium]NIN63033.1 hypothetical protein [Gammaproteobacteria bacterium]NIO63327.1 hypothetical protein [Gammaproteobacteria bacterium]NIP50035.1 hypothetical protein [Gammaproteobacteria bacterium]NIQ12253.1 hypothetical protein [Gammaproteobacteria bacterium]
MKKNSILFSYLLLMFSVSSNTQARIVCWTNSDGVRECGDSVPPEYSQQGHKEFSEQGIIVDETEAAMTDTELEELKRITAEKAKQKRREEMQKRRDRMLLDTFASAEDIELARDRKISAIDSSISLAERRINNLRQEKDRLITQAAGFERQGKEIPGYITEDINRIDRQITANNEFIADKREEQEVVRARHDRDIKRYNEIRLLRR